MGLLTGAYLRTREIRAFTLHEYFTHSIAPTSSILFTRSQLPLAAGSWLLVWDCRVEGWWFPAVQLLAGAILRCYWTRWRCCQGRIIFADHTSVLQPFSNPTPMATV